MDTETLNSYIKAGKIAAKALNFGKDLIKPDSSMIEVLNQIEKNVQELGGELAFPAQISTNDTAAHFCPNQEDIIFKDQVCCLDVGVHVNGYIGDNALTVDLSKNNEELVKASREALNSAIKIIQPGTTLGEIGKTIQETIESFNFKPVKNLSGHGLGQYEVHTSPSIPNYDNKDETELKENQVIAIEPFASTGAGMIEEKGTATVFELVGKKPVRSLYTKELLKKISKLPFTTRWIDMHEAKFNLALRELRQLGTLREYPPLLDKNNGLVSQAEHTVIVKNKPIITTQI